ncbi:MAG TPA: glycosyltransferase [Candidatus Nanopelagicaceae bacterium]|nr:glycosyltransferase [Candidatus Nanopelagicaceae bacterium]
MENKKCVWIFSFEYAGVAKVGGLGEVPANQAKYLSEQFKITVFMPSHGKVEDLKSKYTMERLPFTCVGTINPTLFGIMEEETSYNISFYKFKKENVEIILLSGDNSFTSKFLDDKTVYNPNTIMGKIALFSLGIRCLVSYFIESKRNNLPKIVHLHDYHAVLPFFGMKQVLARNGLEVASILTIHLMTWPRFEYNFFRICAIDDTPIKVLLSSGFEMLNLDQILQISQLDENKWTEFEMPAVEKIGAIISDIVTTVSESYLNSDIIPNCGKGLIEFKADFIWDGCDWDYYEIFNQVIETHGNEIRNFIQINDNTEINEQNMKRFLLEYKIGHLSHSPLISSQNVLNTINEISNGNPFIKNGNIKAFLDSGPLVLTTGRISPQKGFDTIFEAVPEVLKVIPNAKFLFLILPTDYSINEIKTYSQFVNQYPQNIRIIFGVASDIFYLAHLSADVFVSPSRWEPFGIMALEAMSCKIPIIGTKVGGLQETIIDMRNFSEIGTGILIEKDNPSQFAEALISLLLLAEISKRVKEKNQIYETENFKLVNKIPDEILKSLVLLDPNYFIKIRENCYRRVENNFRWKIVSKKLALLYENLNS